MVNVSVIIPTYNREKELVKAIKSVLNQNYKDFEIIVCDDGSTDETEKAVEKIKSKKIKYFKIKHSGLPGKVRNYGVKKGKGKWIAFLDSDDEWEENKLKEQFNLIKNKKCSAVCTNAFRLESNKKSLFFKKSKSRMFRFQDLLENNSVICSSVIIKKSLIKKAKFFPETKRFKVFQDYALWLKISSFRDFYYINKPLVNYCDDKKNSNRKFCTNYKLQKKRVLYHYLNWELRVRKNYKNIIKTILYLFK